MKYNSPQDVESFLMRIGYPPALAYDAAHSAGVEDALTAKVVDVVVEYTARAIAERIEKASP